MIQILLIYYFSKAHYNNALNHERSKWLYAILNIGVYVSGAIAGVLISWLVLFFVFEIDILDWPSYLLDVMGIPMGALASWLLLNFLKKKWSYEVDDSDLLDDFE